MYSNLPPPPTGGTNADVRFHSNIYTYLPSLGEKQNSQPTTLILRLCSCDYVIFFKYIDKMEVIQTTFPYPST